MNYFSSYDNWLFSVVGYFYLLTVIVDFFPWHVILVQLTDLPGVDCLLITQSLDDHCHLKTLKPLSQKLPNLRVIATPNAKSLLDPLFSNVSVLRFI